MGSQHGTKNDSKHSRRNAKDNGNKVLATLDSPGDPKQGRKNNWHPRKDPETTASEGIISPAERLKSLSAGSHSSSDYSSEDFIQVDPKVNKSKGSDIESPNDVRPLPRYHNIDVSSSDMSSKSEHDSGSSTGGTSQISDLTHESLSHTTSLTESPPIQVMERPAGFDPDRIPSSIFASKSPSPMEWSVASNESLFSIRIGNNSFSRDHVHKLPGDLPNAEESNKSSESSIFNPRLPGVREMESDRNDVNMGRNFGERVAAATHKTKKDALIATANDQSRVMLQDQELSFNHHLDGGTSNFQTFAIPKKEKHVGSSWCCSNCSCGSCCCIRLSCCSSAVGGQAAAVVSGLVAGAVSGQVAGAVSGRAAGAVVAQAVVAVRVAVAAVGQAAAVVRGQAAAKVASGQAATVVSGQAAVALSGKTVAVVVRCQLVLVVTGHFAVVRKLDKEK
ncbi:hypothetical protein U1Q18_016723 [Sarracenia purpurea var. burkii]